MEKNVSKKKESLNFEGNKTISFGSNTLVIYPAEGIFNNPMKKKLAEKKKVAVWIKVPASYLNCKIFLVT